MSYQPQDFFFRKAKAEGYVARSVYKLQAIQQRYRLFYKGMRIIDLGAAPGSWSQYLLEEVGEKGEVFAIDLQPLKISHPRLNYVQLDVFSDTIFEVLQGKKWSGVVSDMAPATTGIRSTDHMRSALLVERSLLIAQRVIETKGFWVSKLLEGAERDRLYQSAKRIFQEVFLYRPPATRKGSTECFLIGRFLRSPSPER